MAFELKELGQILDKTEDSEAQSEAIRTAIQALLFHQVIYDDMHNVPSAAISTLKENRIFFEKYFAAAGFKLITDSRSQMIALVPEDYEKPPYGWRQLRLKKDETIVRLSLRFMFEKGLASGGMDETGRVHTDTIELMDTYQKIAKSAPPSERHLMENIIRDLSRIGCVRVGERDKDAKVTRLTILPGIRVMVSDEFVERLEEWLEKGDLSGFLDDQSVESVNV